uniref:Uncharacterized protein n=1 Tax=Ixodes ricinus TaxID=34613 RepID=A0A6B0UXK0_IXORI
MYSTSYNHFLLTLKFFFFGFSAFCFGFRWKTTNGAHPRCGGIKMGQTGDDGLAVAFFYYLTYVSKLVHWFSSFFVLDPQDNAEFQSEGLSIPTYTRGWLNELHCVQYSSDAHTSAFAHRCCKEHSREAAIWRKRQIVIYVKTALEVGPYEQHDRTNVHN